MAKDRLVVSIDADDIAENIAKEIGAEIKIAKRTTFPDSETKITIPGSFRGKKVLLVARLFPQQATKTIEAQLTSEYIIDRGGSVEWVVPYIPYARQDRSFLKGEIPSIIELSYVLRKIGIEKVYTIDIHSKRGASNAALPIVSISATCAMASFAKENIGKGTVVVAPDSGAKGRALEFAKEAEAKKAIILDKERDRRTGKVATQTIYEDLSKDRVVIVDDMISTGSTMVNAINAIGKAKEIHVMAVHGLLVEKADKRIIDAGAKSIITTNTILNPYARIDISSLFANTLRQEAGRN